MPRLIRLSLTVLAAGLMVACTLSAHSQSGLTPANPPVRHPAPVGVLERLEQRIDDLEKRVAVLEAARRP